MKLDAAVWAARTLNASDSGPPLIAQPIGVHTMPKMDSPDPARGWLISAR